METTHTKEKHKMHVIIKIYTRQTKKKHIKAIEKYVNI